MKKKFDIQLLYKGSVLNNYEIISETIFQNEMMNEVLNKKELSEYELRIKMTPVSPLNEHQRREVERTKYLNELKNIILSLDNYEDYFYEDENQICHVSSEWLVGKFSGREFVGMSKDEAIESLKSYFDRHIGSQSMVGDAVYTSGWPDLDKVKKYALNKNHKRQ